MKGAYILIMKLDKEEDIQIGRLGKFHFKKGFYAYVGSALGPGGFKRVERHFNIARGKNPTRKWHIDYLLPHTNVDCAILIPTEKAIECSLSRNLNDMKDIQRISGFGCSDCFCDAHLFYAENDIKDKIIDICNMFGKSVVMNYEIS